MEIVSNVIASALLVMLMDVRAVNKDSWLQEIAKSHVLFNITELLEKIFAKAVIVVV